MTRAQAWAGLLLVGCQAGGPPVLAVVALLGIHHHGHPQLAPAGDERRQSRSGEQALAVVADDHAVEGAAGGEAVQKGGHQVRAGGTVVLPVGADHLLVVGDDAGLDGGGPLGRTPPGPLVADAPLGQQAPQVARRLVPAAEGEEHHLGAQGPDVGGHVGRAAQLDRLALQAHHGHRGLGADAVHPPPEEAVDHAVADHGQAAAREAGDDVLVFRVHGSVLSGTARPRRARGRPGSYHPPRRVSTRPPGPKERK